MALTRSAPPACGTSRPPLGPSSSSTWSGCCPSAETGCWCTTPLRPLIIISSHREFFPKRPKEFDFEFEKNPKPNSKVQKAENKQNLLRSKIFGPAEADSFSTWLVGCFELQLFSGFMPDSLHHFKIRVLWGNPSL